MTLREAALWYAQSGFRVFPLAPKAKRPITKNGFKDATSDPQTVQEWWKMYPDANIGFVTGNGLMVVDVDMHGKDGKQSIKQWEDKNGPLPMNTWLSKTGGGGAHAFFKVNQKIGNKKDVLPGVDIRGDGGYIVAPPSIHESGNLYEWVQEPKGDPAMAPDNLIRLCTWDHSGSQAEGQQVGDIIPEGNRTDYLFKRACSMQEKGYTDEAIRAAILAENMARCSPPLTDKELEREVLGALKRYQKGKRYPAVYDNGKFHVPKNHSTDMVTMDQAEEKEPDWLVNDYIPKYQITSLAGDGGSGKTTVWCALAAAVSTGRQSFFESLKIPEEWEGPMPGKVMFFSAEDSFEYTLKRRLRKNGANLENILSIDIADERFKDVKFNSPFLEQLISVHRPVLCIFDPIQAFVPPDIRMGDRNAMRACTSPLIGYGEKYGATFVIIEHTNKQAGVWGRKRIADSADIWDISRSVLMAGETNEKGVRYITHEKSNYGVTGQSILYTIEDEVLRVIGYSEKKDKDFVTAVDYNTRQAPQRDEAKEFILDFLKGGEKEVSELDEMANAMSISKATMKRAKADLKKDGKIKYRTVSMGRGQGTKFYISLMPSEEVI